MELLTSHCEAPWLEALGKIPESSASVQAEVAGSCWTAVHVLHLVMHPIGGTLTREAYDWAQQLTAPFQPWYESLGGVDDRVPDANGVLVCYPVRSLNSAFVRPDPRVTYFASSHVRYPCLFLRFLVDRVVAGVDGAMRTAAQISKTIGPLGARIKASSVAECVIEPFWGEGTWCVDLGNRTAPSQRVIPRLPKPVVRVLKVVGSIPRGADDPPTALKHDDPARFRKWFHQVFDVAEQGNPLPRSAGGFVPAWHIPKRKHV
jgi:hypothetical protein